MTHEEFFSLFGPMPGHLSKPVFWDDGLGFSLVEEYENGYSSLYKIGFKGTDRSKLWLSASYGKKTSGGVSLGTGQNLRDPVDLEFNDEYQYVEQTRKITHNGREVEPADALKRLLYRHKLPGQRILGAPLRLGLFFWRRALPAVIRCFDWALRGSLMVVSGERTDRDIWLRMFRDVHKDTPIGRGVAHEVKSTSSLGDFESSKPINFFGYEAKKQSVVFYCGLHLLAYGLAVWYGLTSEPIFRLVNSEFLLLCYAVVTFSLIERQLPRLIKFVLRKNLQFFRVVCFKTLRI
jgi:hypothetical protein